MCGIAGIFRTGNAEAISPALIERMTNSLTHRGPDDEGTYIDESIALGHRRLSIIDLSSNARQPLSNEDDTLLLVFNGEIYNHQAIRERLLNKGHQFKSQSDSEVILHLYEECSTDLLNQLEGMFAFALYDTTRRLLLLARDRAGEKPLYYTWVGDTFYFASEIKSFWSISDYRPEISQEAVLNYFLHTQVPAPYSIFKNVYKLLPAHYMIVESGKEPVTKPYWHIDFTRKTVSDFDQAKNDLEAVLTRAINKSMVSDVPIGVPLSGGIDSSMVLAVIAGSSDERIKTFTLGRTEDGVEDPEFHRAKRIADLYDTDHFVFQFDNIGFNEFEKVVRRFDEPVGIYDAIYTFYFHEYVKRHVKVIVTGNGADEIFGGYKSYSAFTRKAVFQQALVNMRAEKQKFINSIIEKRLNRQLRANARQVLSDQMVEFASTYDVHDCLRHYYQVAKYDHLLDAKLFLDLMVALNHTPSLADTTGMANSLESRSPFLDREVLEFSASLPPGFKVKFFKTHRWNKYILKKLSANYMPEDMVYVDKYPCGKFIDVLGMMKTIWKKDIDELLFDYGPSVENLVSSKKSRVMWDKFREDKLPDFERYLFLKLVIFMIWHRQVVDNIGRFQANILEPAKTVSEFAKVSVSPK